MELLPPMWKRPWEPVPTRAIEAHPERPLKAQVEKGPEGPQDNAPRDAPVPALRLARPHSRTRAARALACRNDVTFGRRRSVETAEPNTGRARALACRKGRKVRQAPQ